MSQTIAAHQNARHRPLRLALSALLGGLVLGTLTASTPLGTARYGLEYVDYTSVTPSYLTLTQSWNALGLDDADRVYNLWTSTRDDGREDTALFRYTRATGEREFLGTFIDVATRQQNLQQGEELPKGHTRIIQVGRKLYMASQGFHDFKGDLDALPQYRGAHLFAYDLDTGAFDDVSRLLPNGVVVAHQGIVALTYSPELKLLIGLTHPLGDLVLFDVERGVVQRVVKGIPWQPDHVVSREIVATKLGKVYMYRGAEEVEGRYLENEVWAYDLATDQLAPTGQKLVGGFWNGQTQTRDRDTIYLSTVAGELYALDVMSERFTHLGQLIAPEDTLAQGHYGVRLLYGITLSSAEDSIVGVPTIAADGGFDLASAFARVMVYDIAARRVSAQLTLGNKVFTGSDHRDRQGNIYMSAFDSDGHCKLAILTPEAD